MNTPPPFEYPAADAREFFVPCDKYDLDREDFWCNCHPPTWVSMMGQNLGFSHGTNCGQHWRKKVAVPDGGYVLGLSEIIPDNHEAYDAHTHRWHHVAAGVVGATVTDAMSGLPWYVCFIRRIPATVQPAPKADLSATHRLKCWPEFFAKIRSREKRFEARKNDRDFRVGDTLLLLEWNPQTGQYTGEVERARVSYMLAGPNFGVERDYCVMSLEDVK